MGRCPGRMPGRHDVVRIEQDRQHELPAIVELERAEVRRLLAARERRHASLQVLPELGAGRLALAALGQPAGEPLDQAAREQRVAGHGAVVERALVLERRRDHPAALARAQVRERLGV